MSNWVGYACSYAPYGPVQWRLPLGIQIPWGVIMFVGLATFMPNSPRQLIRSGKIEEAAMEFSRIRRGFAEQEVQEEFALMQAQIEYEMEREITSYREIFRVFRSRVLVYVFLSFSFSTVHVFLLDFLFCLFCSIVWIEPLVY